MTKLEMQGPFLLSVGRISETVTKTSAGNYALGYVDDEKVFRVKYVGRSDSDVAARLRKHVGEKYKLFKYSYATSPKAAFEKECRNYHDFGESRLLDNDIHPDRPKGANWKCPCCNHYG